MTTHKAIREALATVETICEWTADGHDVWAGLEPFDMLVGNAEDARDAAFIASCNPAAIRALLADLDAKTDSLEAKADRIDRLGEIVERETAARREAQEQLYAERERHTAEVKKLQTEIGRLQALRPVAMTPSEVTEAFDSELRSSYTDFEAGIRTAEIHHGITQKEQVSQQRSPQKAMTLQEADEDFELDNYEIDGQGE